MFKKIQIVMFFIIVGLLSNSGCSDNDREFISQEITETFQVPAGLNVIESHYFKLNGVFLFYKNKLSNNGLNTDNPREVAALRASISNKFGNVDLSVIESISIFAVKKGNRTDRVEIFYNEAIPFVSTNEIRLLANISNFYPYIYDDSIDLEVRLKFRGFLQQPVQAVLNFEYLVYLN
jgi:hypothetical protein